MAAPRYWIGVASLDHIERGLAGGFCQLCHGKAGPIKRMHAHDWLIYYSPKRSMDSAEPYQAFTALGRVVDERVFQYEMFPGFIPWRRKIHWLPAQHAPIRPLLDQLTCIPDTHHWGAVFRYGHLEINASDFELIATAMSVKISGNH